MSFPAASVTVPTLASYQLSFNGLTLGPGTAFEFSKIEGTDMPEVRSGDAARAREHGMFIGLDLMGGRQITVTGDLGPVAGSTFAQSRAALAAATIPGGTVEIPLWLNLPGFGTLCTMARCRKRALPIDIAYTFGLAKDIPIQWNSSDPRLYGATQAPVMNLPSFLPGSGGLGFPFGFPIAFGGGTAGGSLTVSNPGNIDTAPVLTFTGPCIYPALQNNSIPGDPVVQFGVTLNTGDQLVVDTDFHTALLYPAGSTVGSPVEDTLQPGSTWWTLQPGLSYLNFTSKDSTPAAGTCTVGWAPAYIL